MVHRASTAAFVGRSDELGLLTATFARVAAGQTATLLIGGDAGVGKSRLVEEFTRQVRDRGALVASGACVPVDGGGLPYGPVVGIVRDLADQPGTADVRGGTAATALDLLGPLSGGPPSELPDAGSEPSVYTGVESITDEMRKTRLFESILRGLARFAEAGPVVIVFDDLHWADSGSTDLFGFLARNLADHRVLLVGTFRSDEIGRDHRLRPWLSELSRHRNVSHLRLDGLDRDAVTEMIGDLVGRRPDWTLVDAVWGRSQGNPFFVEELTVARREHDLSPELQDIVMGRVERLSRDAQLVLRLVAVAGSAADHRLLATVGVVDASDLHQALADAIDHRVLVPDEAQVGYRFRHALFHEAVARALLPGERAELHRRVAIALTDDAALGPQVPAHRAADLATHWWHAGEWLPALQLSTVAAEAAIAMWAFPEALVNLERALAAFARTPPEVVPPSIDHLQLLERAADVAYLVGEAERCVELARRAIDVARAGRGDSDVARCYALLGRNAWAIGDSALAFSAYRDAKALVSDGPPSVELAHVLAEEARGLMMMSRFVEAEVRCAEAVAVARRVGSRQAEGHALCTLGCCRAAQGYHDEGLETVRAALEIANDLANADDVNRVYMALSALLVESGRLVEGAAVALDAAAVGEHLWGVRLNGAAGNSVEALVRLGRLDDAGALLDQTSDHGVGSCTAGPSLMRLSMAIRRGRVAEAGEWMQLADELTAQLDDLQTRGVFHTEVAALALLDGRPDDAFEAIQQGLALAVGTDDEMYVPQMYAISTRCLAEQLEGARATGVRFDLDKARLLAAGFTEEAAQLVEGVRRRGGTPAPRVEAFAATCAAESSRLTATDPPRWSVAGDLWEAAEEPFHQAYCRWREAEARLERRDDRRTADARLREAWQLCVTAGFDGLLADIERLAQRARITLAVDRSETAPDRSTLGSDLGLTPREIEVLAELAAGRSDREIADRLFISKKTVSVHVSNLIRKLDVSNRIGAGRIGQAHGLGRT